jgi:purine catabolism regulator
VSWAVRLRARAPALPRLSGGDLVLVPLATLLTLDGRPSLAYVLGELAELRVAAVAVIGGVDPEAERVASRAQLPLVVLGGSVRPELLELHLQQWIVRRKLELQHEITSLHSEFTGVVLEGGFPSLLDRAVRVTGKPTLLHGTDWGVRLRRQPPNGGVSAEVVDAALAATVSEAERWAETLDSGHEPRLAHLPVPDLHVVRLVAGVRDRQGTGAYLSLLARPTEVGDRETGALLAAAGAASIELVREHASASARDEVEGDLLERLYRGQIQDEAALSARARRLGLALDQPHVCLVADATEPTALQALEALASERGALTRVLDGQAVTLGRLAPHELREWHATWTAAHGSMSVGYAGPATGLPELAQALADAGRALELGRRLLGPGQLVAFSDLGIYRLLLQGFGGATLEAFYQSALGQLHAYDRERGTELLQTLEAYFASRCSPEATARRLFLHRNSLVYRLRRIEEIAAIRLDDPETRLMLHLALRVGQVLPLALETRTDAG